MHVIVRHDDTIQGSDRLSALTEGAIEAALGRFGAHITGVEVHYADENGHRRRGEDIRCTIEVRFEGLKPVAATAHAGDLPVALDAAAEKVARLLEHHLGRIREHDRAAVR